MLEIVFLDSSDGISSSDGMKKRDLTAGHLRSFLEDSKANLSKSVSSMSRITSYSVLSSLDSKMKKGMGEFILLNSFFKL